MLWITNMRLTGWLGPFPKIKIALSSAATTICLHVGRRQFGPRVSLTPSPTYPSSLPFPFSSLSVSSTIPSPSFHSTMASVSAATMAMPQTSAGNRKPFVGSNAFFHPLKRLPAQAPASKIRASIRASSLEEKAVAGLTAAAVTAAMVIPDVAEAAQPGISPSLKNFLLSIVSGGVVLGVIVGAVIGVANFDPVKRS